MKKTPIILVILLNFFLVIGTQAIGEERLALDDLFSEEQAQKGANLFVKNCTQCHSSNQAIEFMYSRWTGKSLEKFVSHIGKTMPPESIGALKSQDYLDITAYLLHESGVKSGQRAILVTSSQWQKTMITSSGSLRETVSEGLPLSSLDWTAYRGDGRSQGYSSANAINRNNVGSLEVVWRWSGQNHGPIPELKNITTPLMVNGVLYFTAGLTRNVVAVAAATGETLWMWRANEGERFETAPRKGAGRGVAYWNNPNGNGRILTVTPGFQLVALDALTGQLVEEFGNKGVVDLRQGLRLAGRGEIDIGSSSPPLIVHDTVVVGPAHASGMRAKSKRNVKGDVRAYDVRTGKHKWTFNTIPKTVSRDGSSWKSQSHQYTGNAGVWAPMSADPELNLIYLPVESATND